MRIGLDQSARAPPANGNPGLGAHLAVQNVTVRAAYLREACLRRHALARYAGARR